MPDHLEDVIYATDSSGTPVKYERDDKYTDLYWEMPFGCDGGSLSEDQVKEQINTGIRIVLPREEWIKLL